MWVPWEESDAQVFGPGVFPVVPQPESTTLKINILGAIYILSIYGSIGSFCLTIRIICSGED